MNVTESGVAYKGRDNCFGECVGLGEGWKKGKMPSNRKKMSSKKQKRGEERKRKEKVNTAMSLLNLNPNFAFSVCPNVEGWIYETEGRKVYDL